MVGHGLTRRVFGAGAASLFAWPLPARGQTGKIPRVGFLGPERTNPAQTGNYGMFSARLAENGFREGQNIIVEYRATDDARGPFANAADLLKGNPDLIVAAGPEVALQAVGGAKTKIPIVMLAVNFDPIGRGYAASLARPGGNITGVLLRPIELAGKQLELLTEAFPGRRKLAVMFDALTEAQFAGAERAAQSFGLETKPIKLEIPVYDFEGAFNQAEAAGAQMILVLSSPAFSQHRDELGHLGIKHRIPTMFTFKLYVEAGGLMSYGVEFPPVWRRTADYVAKILKGAKPADLPIEQAEKFEFAVNLKTAKALGVTVPTGILLRADQVIE